ncbi:MAG TPA: hypothetical protein VHR45_12420 [Thermoanaerobaculia bacterium]|nr:hypothetical protein [Thermoanaerobaculia bacterium]
MSAGAALAVLGLLAAGCDALSSTDSRGKAGDKAGAAPAAARPTPTLANEGLPSDEELQKRRVEWEEQMRLAEQHQAEIDKWARTHHDAQSLPRVGRQEESALQRALQAWYPHYSRRSAMVKSALAKMTEAERDAATRTYKLIPACREVRTSATLMLADAEAMTSPDPEVNHLLSYAYTHLLRGADQCIYGRADLMPEQLAAAQDAMGQAAARLRTYNLAP